MKKVMNVAACLVLCLMMSSCYVSTYVVGNGAQSNTEVKGKNNYFVGGLITGKQVDTKSMANGATDYTVQAKFSFVDQLLNAVTLGIYSPRTVTVTR